MRIQRRKEICEVLSAATAVSPKPLEVIQWGDYECKECGLAAELLQAFRHRHDGVVHFTYKHFPLLFLHRKALQAAEAAECARAQDRFWQMHNRLVANPDRLGLPHLYDYAESVGLDMARFTSDMDEERHVPTIRIHIQSATLVGVRRTPSFLVGGTSVDAASGIRPLIEATNWALARRNRQS